MSLSVYQQVARQRGDAIALAQAADDVDKARAAYAVAQEQRDALERALHEVLDALGAIQRPWELQGHGFAAKRAEEICDLISHD